MTEMRIRYIGAPLPDRCVTVSMAPVREQQLLLLVKDARILLSSLKTSASAGTSGEAIQAFAQRLERTGRVRQPTVAHVDAAHPALDDVIQALVDDVAADAQLNPQRRRRPAQVVRCPAATAEFESARFLAAIFDRRSGGRWRSASFLPNDSPWTGPVTAPFWYTQGCILSVIGLTSRSSSKLSNSVTAKSLR